MRGCRTDIGKLQLCALCAVIFFSATLPSITAGAQPADSAQADSVRARRNLPDPPLVTARFVPDSVGIADLFSLDVEVTKDVMQQVAFPEFDDNMLGGKIEIVGIGQVDTLVSEGRRHTLRLRYKLQSFEQGYFGLGHFPALYVDKNIVDTIWSVDSLTVKIGMYDIDTTRVIYDIKRVREMPLKVGEISGYLLWGLLVLAVIAAGVWWLHTRRRNLSILGRPKPVVPPHVEAIKALESLHHQKLWQNGKYKLYYTGITDVLRVYVEKRFEISAMEMTSPEIIGALATMDLPAKAYSDLSEILQTADLVKFAKYEPDADVNEGVYTKAYYFVEETKPTEIEPTVSEKEQKI